MSTSPATPPEGNLRIGIAPHSTNPEPVGCPARGWVPSSITDTLSVTCPCSFELLHSMVTLSWPSPSKRKFRCVKQITTSTIGLRWNPDFVPSKRDKALTVQVLRGTLGLGEPASHQCPAGMWKSSPKYHLRSSRISSEELMGEERQGNMPTASWEQTQLWGTRMHCGNTGLAQKTPGCCKALVSPPAMTGRMCHVPHISSSSLLFSCNSYTEAGHDPGQKPESALGAGCQD